MKLAVVTPRYGAEVAGGAETAARLLASAVAARDDWEVEALTTTARDAATWANAYPAGAETIDGVTVQRFTVTGTRSRGFDQLTERVVVRGRKTTDAELTQWVDEQGPVAPGLVDAIATSDADVIAFHPYLYHPTVAGLPRVASRAVLHPAAHDEPVLDLRCFRDVFARAAGLAFWSEPERHLVERRFQLAQKPEVVVGLGVDSQPGDPAAARSAVGLAPDEPFVLCLGRVDDGKGARLLAECFATYRTRRSTPCKLVFAGPVVDAPPAHPDIVVAGMVDEPVKWGLLRGAHALVSPSLFESFSIVLMEAWCVETPALVNGLGPVTADHARRSGGALTFADYPEFEVALDRVLDDPALRAALGSAGRAYVDRHYRWPDVVDRYTSFLARIATNGDRGHDD